MPFQKDSANRRTAVRRRRRQCHRFGIVNLATAGFLQPSVKKRKGIGCSHAAPYPPPHSRRNPATPARSAKGKVHLPIGAAASCDVVT